MKNEVFNFQRFWNYFKYDFTQMWRGHVKAAVGIGLMGLIFYFLFNTFHLILSKGDWQGPSLNARLFVFGLAGFALTLYVTRIYGYLTDRRKGSAWLMNPASTFEKWVSMLIMTLIVIPCAFLGSSLLVDSVITLADPTVDKSIISSFQNIIKDINENLVSVNNDYMTTWSIGTFTGIGIAAECVELLYFLLCGITFRKYKILGAFGIILGLSFIAPLVVSFMPIGSNDISFEDPAAAEQYFRHIMTTATIIAWAIAACLAGGVFWRLKTLKH